MGIEYKSFPMVIEKDSIDGRAVTGITSVFGNLDDGNDIIHRGAFKKTIKENKNRVKHLWQHDSFMPPIAAIKQMREVGRAELPEQIQDAYPDAKGGLQVTREYLTTPRGEEVLEGIRAGAITEMSIGFSTVKVDFDEDEGKSIRNIREVRLFDTSDVNWGMNSATVAAKSALGFKMGKLGSYLDDALSELLSLEDEDLTSEDLYKRIQAGVDGNADEFISKLDQLMQILKTEPEPEVDPSTLLNPHYVLAELELCLNEN